jgi:ketosteroid isomerase-like protein
VSQEKVQRAREAYEALTRAVQAGDFDRFFADYVHPDAESVPIEGSPDSVEISRGHDALKERWAEMSGAMHALSIEAEDFTDAGDRIVVAVRMSGRGRASGACVEARRFHVLTERQGKAVRIEWYQTRDEALKATGLSE